MDKSNMKYIDLFAGVGGFRHGIESFYANRSEERGSKENKEENKREGLQPQKGENISSEDGWISEYSTNRPNQGPLCVYSNEFNKYANSVYRRHYGKCDNRDIRTVKSTEIPDHDLLCGGFPCQSFSIAGKRGGFDDTRGTLFFEIARIAKEKRPRYLLLENVKGLLSHDKGKTFQTIIGVLSDLGYRVEWQVLNSKHFGVPQNRERVFIIGHLGGKCRGKIFPIGIPTEKDNKGIKEPGITARPKYINSKRTLEWKKTNISNTLKAVGPVDTGTTYIKESKESGIIQLNHPTHSNDRIYGEKGLTPTLNTMQGGRRQPKIANTIDANYYKGINVNPGHASSTRGIMDGIRIRRLTPTECERLQGFPDDWTAKGVNGEIISDSQRYKMCGNAVTTNVITAIFSQIVNNFDFS